MKKNFLKIALLALLTLPVYSCGDEKGDKLEDQLEERSDALEDRADNLEDASDDLGEAGDDIEDALDNFRDALEEVEDPQVREEIRNEVNKMIDDMNMKSAE
ncbi:hypothetical protein [Zunongwangia sp. H14]|uniref:hypothetical protein n=1 Tax=Zunongwangia sp. H14 TaxID=3240792 RepID=UPI0035671FC2